MCPTKVAIDRQTFQQVGQGNVRPEFGGEPSEAVGPSPSASPAGKAHDHVGIATKLVFAHLRIVEQNKNITMGE